MAFRPRHAFRESHSTLRGACPRSESTALPPRGAPPRPASQAPFVLAMNHHSFFDGHLVWFLFKVGGIRGSLLVSEGNLRAFPVLRSAGALDAHRLREALRRLKSGEAVAVFPKGEMRPAGPLRPLKPGAGWLAKKAGVPILSMAFFHPPPGGPARVSAHPFLPPKPG